MMLSWVSIFSIASGILLVLWYGCVASMNCPIVRLSTSLLVIPELASNRIIGRSVLFAVFNASRIMCFVSMSLLVMGSGMLAFFRFHFGSVPISISWCR